MTERYRLGESIFMQSPVYHHLRPGTIFYNGSNNCFQSDDGFYPFSVYDFEKIVLEKCERLPDVPYSPDYYLRLKQIEKLQKANLEEEEKYNQTNNQ